MIREILDTDHDYCRKIILMVAIVIQTFIIGLFVFEANYVPFKISFD